MSELCLDCYNKIMKTHDPRRKFIFSLHRDLCEECGQYKQVIIRVKWRYILKEEFTEIITRCKENRPSHP